MSDYATRLVDIAAQLEALFTDVISNGSKRDRAMFQKLETSAEDLGVILAGGIPNWELDLSARAHNVLGRLKIKTTDQLCKFIVEVKPLAEVHNVGNVTETEIYNCFLFRVFGTLTEVQKMILHQRLVEKMPFREIAVVHGVSESVACSRFHLARRIVCRTSQTRCPDNLAAALEKMLATTRFYV